MGVFITPVADTLGIYRGTFAIQTTITYLSMAISSLFVPRLISYIKIKKVIGLGITMASLSTILMSATEQVWVFNILGGVRGVGMGYFAMVPTTVIVNNWFEKKSGLAVSISFCFSGIIGAIFSPIFIYLH